MIRLPHRAWRVVVLYRIWGELTWFTERHCWTRQGAAFRAARLCRRAPVWKPAALQALGVGFCHELEELPEVEG